MHHRSSTTVTTHGECAVGALVGASHIEPTLAVTAFTTALAVDAGRGWGSVSVAAAVLCGQLTVGWNNDYVDRDRDRLVERNDKPIVAGDIPAAAVRAAAIGAGMACIPLSLLSGWRAGCVHLAAVCIALAYNVWLKKTMLSVVPYAIAFGSLPAFVSLGLDQHHFPAGWSMTAASLLGAGAHFINALPDLDDDEATGVRGLPHRCGSTLSLLIGAGLLTTSTVVVIVAPHGRPSFVSVLLAVVSLGAVLGVVISSVAGNRRTAWYLCLATAGATVALYLTRQ